ncbi:hypothetical protein [Cupriavidus sp. D384]|uniref:hypothetical protein n=1 Tax=Cupriavidus sp. D384 TaxID=1538095 RepID=UPI0008308D73|nr:hypothetical protein [Cupriavidus sp. D384]
MNYLFNSPILPPGFILPREYIELVTFNRLPDLQPWRFLAKDVPASLSYYGRMLQGFPERPLIPFAMIDDQTGFYNDGWVVLACFDGTDTSGEPSVFVYDYATPKTLPWENLSYDNFTTWMEAAQVESLNYKSELS